MPIKQITPMSEVDNYLEEQLERREQAIIRNLEYVGEQCVNEAKRLPSPPESMRRFKHQPNYIDDTGNLRSSIGYVIVKNGKVVKLSGFAVVKTGREGVRSGAAYARQLVRKFPRGIVLIVVAGMNYAAYVSAKGYNVLDSSELLAEQLVPNLMKQL